MIDRKEYLKNYRKEKLKRVPFDIPIEKYEAMKDHASERGETVNGFLKRAVEETMIRDKSTQ